MRLGVLSDAHGNLEAFEACLAALGPVDRLLFGGDLLGYYFDAPAVLRRLRALGATCIAGNHDLYFLSHRGLPLRETLSVPPPEVYARRYGPALELATTQLSDEEVAWLAALPCARTLDLEGVRVQLVHGSPWRPADEYVYPDAKDLARFDALDAALVIMGHTHRPLIIERPGGPTLLNPGSCGQPRDGDPRPSCAVVTLERGAVRCELLRVEWDRQPLLERCRAIAPDVPLLTELLLRERIA